MTPRKRGSRRRGGWRRKGSKLQAYVRLHDGPGGLRTRTYDLGTAAADMQSWIDETVQKLGRKKVRAAAGTLAADVKAYLQLLVDRPRLQQQRTTQLAWWCDRFGTRPRSSLKSLELETALNELLASGLAPSTVKKYRTALYHLFTKTDGKNAPNPLRDVAPPREPDPQPRAIPYDLIEAIFDAMPDRRYTTKLDEAEAAAIFADATQPHANRSAIARAHGLSETMVRKIVAKQGRRFDTAAQGKARLRVMAYTGLPPAQIKLLEPGHIDWTAPSVLVQGRKKGGGTRSERLPLIEDGVAALRAFADAEAWGKFSSSSMNACFQRGIARMCLTLEAEEATRPVGEQLRQELREATPYWLRHSFLTEAQLATGNISSTQSLAMHSDVRMTRRYTLAAVAPELQRAAALLSARWGGQRTGNESSEAVSGTGKNRPKTGGRKTRPIGKRSEGKSRKRPMK